MFKITLDDISYACEPGQTVLDVLLENDIDVAYGCRQGACQSCQIRSLDKAPPSTAQQGLKDTQIKQNYFLACSCIPEQDLSIKLAPNQQHFNRAKVVSKTMLNNDIVELLLECQNLSECYAGQFVNLQRQDGLTRSYSIANIPDQKQLLELHIRRLPEGRFSEWLHDDVQVGDTLSVSEPMGHCIYLPERHQHGLLLVGTGTGLAPLLGILRDAIAQGHSGPIQLFHGSRSSDELYLIDQLSALANQHRNVCYTPCLSGDDVPEGFAQGRANDVALERLEDLNEWTVYLCGHPEMVEQMQVAAFLRGASASNIYCDAFVTDQRVNG